MPQLGVECYSRNRGTVEQATTPRCVFRQYLYFAVLAAGQGKLQPLGGRRAARVGEMPPSAPLKKLFSLPTATDRDLPPTYLSKPTRPFSQQPQLVLPPPFPFSSSPVFHFYFPITRRIRSPSNLTSTQPSSNCFFLLHTSSPIAARKRKRTQSHRAIHRAALRHFSDFAWP